MESTTQVVAPLYTGLKGIWKVMLYLINKCKTYFLYNIFINYNDKNGYWLGKILLYGTHYAHVPQSLIIKIYECVIICYIKLINK